MSCVTCAQTVEKALQAHSGVRSASVNFPLEKASIDCEDREGLAEELIAAVEKAGYEAGFTKRQDKSFFFLILSLVLSGPFLLHMAGLVHVPPVIQLCLATVIQFYCGKRFYTSAFWALRALSANMDVLVAMGTSAAYGFSVAVMLSSSALPLYFESGALIITLVLLGQWLEGRSKKRARAAIEALVRLRPKTVFVKREGEFIEKASEEVVQGDILLVRPGDRIPVDGIVQKGESEVNESMLTGESVPVIKEIGDQVFAATIVQGGSFEIRATEVGETTVLAAMIRLVEEAQHSKAPIQRLADQVSGVFVPIVILISLITLLGWLWAGFLFHVALVPAVSVLVIACPCALGLATPTVIVVASGIAAKMGMLFRRVSALEFAESIDTLLLDKTGTLTLGEPTVHQIYPASSYTEEAVIQIASSLAIHSKHPLSQGICVEGKNRGVSLSEVKEFESISGKGVKGKIDGKIYHLGSCGWAESMSIEWDVSIIRKLQEKGESIAILWEEKKTVGYISLNDALRPHAKEAIDLIKKLKIQPIIISGDTKKVVASIAKDLGIKKYYSEVLPKEKMDQVKKAGKKVGMVGDGINDAPALAAADVSFAIDTGSDVALESADILLLGADLRGIPRSIDLSKATFRKIRQNLMFAFLYNTLAIPIAALGWLSPVVAASAMALSSLSVVSNALLLRRWKG